MALLPPTFEQNATYNAQTLRYGQSIARNQGVALMGDLFVTPSSGMTVSIAAGTCYIDGDDAAFQGSYTCTNTAPTTVTLTAAPSSGNSRIDLIIGQVRDGAVTGGGSNDWIIDKVTGTPAASPISPAVPPSAILLARITIPALVSSVTTAMISDRRTLSPNYAIVPTGQLPNVGAATGQMASDGTTRSMWNGTSWVNLDFGGMQVINNSFGSVVGPPMPAPNAAQWKVLVGQTTQTFSDPNGKLTLTLPITFTGIVAYFLTPTGTNRGVMLQRREDQPETGNTLKLIAFDASNTPIPGSIQFSIMIIGWI